MFYNFFNYLISFTGNCKFQWTTEITKLLIEEIKVHMLLLSNKNCIVKKIWTKIANNINEKGYNITFEQCAVKWKNLKRKYHSVKDNNNRTGRGRECWEYFDEIDNFMSNKPEIEPVSIVSSTNGFRTRQPSPNLHMKEFNDENDYRVPQTSYGVTRCKRTRQRKDSNSGWMEKLYKQRQIHHAKNIEMQQRFLQLFEKHIQKDTIH